MNQVTTNRMREPNSSITNSIVKDESSLILPLVEWFPLTSTSIVTLFQFSLEGI